MSAIRLVSPLMADNTNEAGFCDLVSRVHRLQGLGYGLLYIQPADRPKVASDRWAVRVSSRDYVEKKVSEALVKANGTELMAVNWW